MTIVYLAGNRISGLSTDTKPTNVPANSIFIETDTQAQYIFDGSSTWNSLGAAGGTNTIFGRGSDGDVTISSNTTLTEDKFYDNLTVNSGVTLDSSQEALVIHCKTKCTVNGTISMNGKGTNAGGDATNIISTVEADPKYNFDLSSSTGWTMDTHHSISSGTLNLSSDSTLDGVRARYDLGKNLSDTFVIRWKWSFSTLNLPSDSDYNWYFGVSSSTSKNSTTHDRLMSMMNLRNSSGVESRQLQALISDDQTLQSGDRATGDDGYYDVTSTWSGTDYYCELIKTASPSTGSFTFNVYSDSSYSNLLNSATNTTSTKSPTGLRYLWSGIDDYSGAGRSPLQWVGTIDDIEIWDNTTDRTGLAGSGGSGAKGNNGGYSPWQGGASYGAPSGQPGQPGGGGTTGGGNAGSASQATKMSIKYLSESASDGAPIKYLGAGGGAGGSGGRGGDGGCAPGCGCSPGGNGGSGGTGGKGGGTIVIMAKEIEVASGGSITANGANGNAGQSGQPATPGCGATWGGSGGTGGGGGGGNGGYVYLVYKTYTNNGTVSATAGSGGGSGSSAGGSGVAGIVVTEDLG